VNNCQAFI